MAYQREHYEQVCVIAWSRAAYFTDMFNRQQKVHDFLYAIPNAAKRGKRVASMMKAEGLKAGVSDLHLPVPMNGYHGLWVEMKSEDGTVRKSQAEWLIKMSDQGYQTAVCRGWREAVQAIMSYLMTVTTRAGKPFVLPPENKNNIMRKPRARTTKRTYRGAAGGKNPGGHSADRNPVQ